MNRLLSPPLIVFLWLLSYHTIAQAIPAKPNSPLPFGFILGDALFHCSGCKYPVYKDGGVEGMLRAISKNVRFPEHLQRDERVFVQFTIDEHGRVRNAVVKQRLQPDADSAAVQAVRLLGEFTPALDTHGRPIAVRQTVPVTFQLK
ncbi:energy transducer TonB [Hymenobacter perfusus]|uniref:Energy transducer TonB n=1 Tax=Hymenobacter perfusus TaxID=1236770 RepID=A0A3R9P1A4_9BACT|nr:TonB family protein [Hymenobacter perfusus]RSK46470.1 energy transducer TonB [Hymenobacter perfusus]